MCALRFVARVRRRKLPKKSNRHYRSKLSKGIRAQMAVCCMLAVARKPSLCKLSSPGNAAVYMVSLPGLYTRFLYQATSPHQATSPYQATCGAASPATAGPGALAVPMAGRCDTAPAAA